MNTVGQFQLQQIINKYQEEQRNSTTKETII